MKSSFFTTAVLIVVVAVGAIAGYAQPSPIDAPPPVTADPVATSAPEYATGEEQYVVILRANPLAAAYADALAQGRRMNDDEQRAYVAGLRAAQDEAMNQIGALGGREITRTAVALNALYIAANSALTHDIAKLSNVRGIQAVIDLQTQATSAGDYKEVVPFIGANTLRDSGVDGTGVRVAVLDSGIDYTHAAFGGAGTSASYFAAYGTSTGSAQNKNPVSWPQGRVIGGYDFVGEEWPNAGLAPDPNPIAAPAAGNSLGILGTDGGHGTSVADIIAGGPFPSRPDNHGIAPGASLYAVKVCSAVSTSCSGIAIIQGIEWALDPNGDGSLSDAVDIINLSLGTNFGQKENPATEAVANAVRVGVIVCCAAGNAGDNPYIVSSPSSAPEAISVAQTTMPSTKVYVLNLTSSAAPSPFSINNTNTVAWAPIVGSATGSVAIPPSGLACARLPAGSLPGKIALIDRGTCNVSYKVAYAQDAGAAGVVLINNAPGDPPSFSYGGIPPDLPAAFAITVPTLVVGQIDGASLKSRINAGESLTATISDAAFIPTASSVVSTSASGPSFNLNTIKPEISAPGANLAAVSGSGTGFAEFSGTSGATPVIAGAAALIRQQYPGLSPLEVKARLMNNAEINTYQNPVTQPGVLTPISRTGAGEVRALPAVTATAAAWVVGNSGGPNVPALSFGFWRLSGPQSFTQTVRVKNYSSDARTFTMSSLTRFSPGLPGAVTLSAPTTLSVAANDVADFTVTLSIDPSKLPAWNTDSGAFGADGPRLAALEYGGFVTLADANDTLRLPWEVLPEKANRALVAASSYILGSPFPTLTNSPSSLPAVGLVYALTGTSPRLPAGSYPAPGDGFAAVDLQNVGVRLVDFGGSAGLGLEFAITSWDRHTHADYPAQFRVSIDVDNDGVPDWYLYNQRASTTDWRNVTYLQGSTWPTSFGTFYTATDFNSANVVLQVPLNRIGLTVPATPSSAPVSDPLPPGHQFSFTVEAFDDYFTGLLTDTVGPMLYTPNAPKYVINGTLTSVTAPAGGSVSLPITGTGSSGSPSQSGVLLLFPNGRTNYESKAINVRP
jgi:subtilisin family serine protease